MTTNDTADTNVPDSGEPTRPWRRLDAVTAIFIVALLVNVLAGLAVAITRGPPEPVRVAAVEGLCGLLLGSLGLVSVWGVFGTGPWFIRWPTTVAAGACLAFSFLVSCFVVATLAAGPRAPSAEDFLAPFLLAPTLLLGAQTPLWLVRYFVGHRFVRRANQVPAADALDGRPGVGHLLAAMTLVAVSLGLARTAFSIRPFGGGASPAEWLGLVIACGAPAAWNALVALPCLWAALLAKKRRWACVGVAVYVLAATFLAVLVPVLIWSLGARQEWSLFSLVLTNGVAATVQMAGLYWIRSGGYDFVRGNLGEPSQGGDKVIG